MEWWESLREKLFGPQVERTGQLHHGPLVRSEGFQKRHLRWLAGSDRAHLLEEYQAMLAQEQLSSDTALHLLSTSQATGVQMKRPSGAPASALQHLHEEFKDKVIAEGYRVHLSDHRISTGGLHRERYYLKPTIPSDALEPPLPQRYGNVLLESWGREADAPEHLKVLITVYSDRLYMPALSGMKLISSLLEEVRGRDLS
jgi:hypothetical protein